jgi:hypothetical protein
MMSGRGINTPIALVIALVVSAACASAAVGGVRTASSRTSVEGAGLMDKCQTSEVLVVENKTPYSARVTATDGTPNAFGTGRQLLQVVPAGVVDTISSMATSHQKVQFDLEQPVMASGVPTPVSGFRARCVPAA